MIGQIAISVGALFHLGSAAQPVSVPAQSDCPEYAFLESDGTCRPGFVPPHIVYFDAHSTSLNTRARQFLDGVVDRFRRRREHLTLVGHTDEAETAAANLQLSERYIASVRDYLLAHGIPAFAITADARGDVFKAVETPRRVSDPDNRRVDILFDGR